jgi:hypothetical protein
MCEQIGVTIEAARLAVSQRDVTDRVWKDAFVPRAGAPG